MTAGTINTSTSVLKPDVHDESFNIDLNAVVIFPPIPGILIGDDISLRDSRSAILLEIRFTWDPESITARHVCSSPVGPCNDTLAVASRTYPLGLSLV